MDGFVIFLAIVAAALATNFVGTNLIRAYFREKEGLIVRVFERTNQGG